MVPNTHVVEHEGQLFGPFATKDEAAKYAIERLFDDFSVFTLYAP